MDLPLLRKNGDHYIHLHADCIPVKGVQRAAIYDLTRNEIILFPVEHLEILEYITSDKIGKCLKELEDEEEKECVLEFIQFLDQNEVIALTKEPQRFPPIPDQWDIPCMIQNAIIDIDQTLPDFEKIIYELDALSCPFVQIRCFSNLPAISDFYQLMMRAKDTSIEGVELIIKYNPDITEDQYTNLVETQPLLAALTIHSSPENREVTVLLGDRDLAYPIDKLYTYTTQVIGSEMHCGIITEAHLNLPTVSNFFEAKHYNGCLNRKVAIDTEGNIKNCPSMQTSYGNISTTSLSEAVNQETFKQVWNIKKDEIEVCKECEFRYACSDCRAYLETPENRYSKPLKCGYNPQTCEWEDWSKNPLKQAAMKHYTRSRQNTERISVH